MAGDSVRLREGSPRDFPTLAQLDGTTPNDWVLYIGRDGGPAEADFRLRWRRLKPEGSMRGSLTENADGDEETLGTEWKRSDRVVISEVDGRAAGYVMLGENWNKTAELTLIIVDRAYRRRGIGRRLLDEAERYTRERGLRALLWEAQNDNRSAIEFALAQGFRIAGFHDALYHNDDFERQEEDDFRGIALFLTKPLT